MHTLGYERYMVFGVSGGGPYALGMAAISDMGHVKAVGVMAGAGPIESSRAGLSVRWIRTEVLMRLFPWYWTSTYNEWLSKTRAWYEKVYAGNTNPGVHRGNKLPVNFLIKIEKARNDDAAAGHVEQLNMGNRSWGYELEEIGRKNVPVYLYHGTLDENTPIGGARYIQYKIGNTCRLKEIPCADHYSTQGHVLELLERVRKKSLESTLSKDERSVEQRLVRKKLDRTYTNSGQYASV